MKTQSEIMMEKQAELWTRLITEVHATLDEHCLKHFRDSSDPVLALKASTVCLALREPEYQLILPPGVPRFGTFDLANNIANHLRILIAAVERVEGHSTAAVCLDAHRAEFANIAGEADFYGTMPF